VTKKAQHEELVQHQGQLAALKEHIRLSDSQQQQQQQQKEKFGMGGEGSGGDGSNIDARVRDLEANLAETLARKAKAESRAKLAVEKIKVYKPTKKNKKKTSPIHYASCLISSAFFELHKSAHENTKHA